MESVAHRSPEPVQIDLDELARLAAREYIALALEAERRAYLEDHAHLLDGDGGSSSATGMDVRGR